MSKSRRDWAWQVPIWCGMDASGWLRLLKRNHYSVDPRCLHRFALISAGAVGNTLLRHVQDLVWSSRVKQTRIVDAPVFVIGHWRSGTSLLHELLALDPEHVAPNMYECMFPNHFLLTEELLSRVFGFLTPSRRPMDNMPMSFEGPLEDEFAMCNLGEPSPYLTIAFPNEPQNHGYCERENASPEAADHWQQSLRRFLQQITVRNSKRIVLKSPPHMGRVKLLLELFPDARFVHIVRDPFVVFPSTLNLWRTLYALQGLQKPTFEGLEEDVLQNYVHLFDRLQESRSLVALSRFYELRYEDLVKAPIEQLRTIYQHLDLGDFERVVPALEQYMKKTVDYQTNRYQLTPEQRDRVAQRWGHVIRRYGYA